VPNDREFIAEQHVQVFENQSSDFFDFTKEVRQITPLDPSWNQRLNWHHFDGCTRMKTNMLHSSPVAQR
jgi:hypothetical protein